MINLNPMGTRPNEGWHIPNVGEAAVRATYCQYRTWKSINHRVKMSTFCRKKSPLMSGQIPNPMVLGMVMNQPPQQGILHLAH